MLMYPNHYGHGLLIYLIWVQFWFKDIGQIGRFQPYSREGMARPDLHHVVGLLNTEKMSARLSGEVSRNFLENAS